jgi:hypothetical protein
MTRKNNLEQLQSIKLNHLQKFSLVYPQHQKCLIMHVQEFLNKLWDFSKAFINKIIDSLLFKLLMLFSYQSKLLKQELQLINKPWY